jgi:hypothetical protein
MEAITIFIVIGTAWALVLYSLLRNYYQTKLKISMKSFTVLIPILGLLFIMVLLFIGIKTYEYTESPEFCSLVCHSMEPYYETYVNPGNNTILETHRDHEVECADCHNGPGYFGVAKTRIEGMGMIISEWTGDYDPDEFKGHVPNEYCEKSGCHDSVDWVIQTVEGEIYHPYTDDGERSPVTGKSCTTCHNPRLGGTGLTKNSCTLCHDVTEQELEAHESRTCGKTTCHGDISEVGHKPTRPKEDACINCHNRKHPSDARVPYSVVDNYIREGVKIDLSVNNEFCSDCHKDQYNDFISFSSGECTDCHADHKETLLPHRAPTDDFYECTDCHTGMIDRHNPINITFTKFIDVLDNEFCSDCHNSEYSIYTSSNSGKCTDCHTDHEKPTTIHQIEAPYDTCDKCHVAMSTNHNPKSVSFKDFPASEITNSFCSSCHFEEYDAYTTYSTPETLESYGNCTSCHNDHRKISYPHLRDSPYNSCPSCHSNYDDNIKTHNPSGISYENFPTTITNEFCSSCHSDQYSSLKDTSDPNKKHSSRFCTNCHGAHREVQVDFGICMSCHDENIPSSPSHDKTLTGCGFCHDVESYIHTLSGQ